MVKKHRKLIDITLDEAIEVLKLGEGYQKDYDYKLRTLTPEWNSDGKSFAQLYYRMKKMGELEEMNYPVVNFSDDQNAVTLCEGNKYYRTHYKIIKFLENQGFDLESANKID